MRLVDQVKTLLNDVLLLNGRSKSWSEATPLIGAVPELDSMAVLGIINALEEDFGLTIAEDEVSVETFATLGSLTGFVEQKLASA